MIRQSLRLQNTEKASFLINLILKSSSFSSSSSSIFLTKLKLITVIIYDGLAPIAFMEMGT